MQQEVNTLGIRTATFSDLRKALRTGWADFLKAPGMGLFFGTIYALGGIVLVWFTFVLDLSWMAYPLVVGFALIGPFIATGLYEISRRLQSDLPLGWRSVLLVIFEQRRRELGWMAFVMLFIFWVWMYQARTLFAVFFGSKGFASFDGFVTAWPTSRNHHPVGVVSTAVTKPSKLAKPFDPKNTANSVRA